MTRYLVKHYFWVYLWQYLWTRLASESTEERWSSPMQAATSNPSPDCADRTKMHRKENLLTVSDTSSPALGRGLPWLLSLWTLSYTIGSPGSWVWTQQIMRFLGLRNHRSKLLYNKSPKGYIYFFLVLFSRKP